MIQQVQEASNIPANWDIPTGRCLLSEMGVISVVGEDANKFVHSMLTHDFALMTNRQARFAALCSPKGRVLATFIGIKKDNNQIYLLCQKDSLAEILKRLSMFLLRAKAKLSDATDQFQIWGLSGVSEITEPHSRSEIWSKADSEWGTLIKLYPALQMDRWLLLAPKENHVPNGELISFESWQFSEVMSAVAFIGRDLMDRFVPQMLNYESIDGISFKKGCYPGQEVVARSQFRGTLKRRAFLVLSQVRMAVGDSLFVSDPDAEPIATIVQGATSPTGEFVAIASGNLGTAPHPALFYQTSDGPAVTVLPLPYPLLEDI